LPKKIEINLLLADLALKFSDALARSFELLETVRLGRSPPDRLLLRGAPASPQSLGATRSKPISPQIQVLAKDLQLP
jgi:hypothetical protein